MMNRLPVHAPSLCVGACAATALLALFSFQSPFTVTATPIPTLTASEKEILSHLEIVQVPDGLGGLCKTIRLSGANLQLVNGAGSTESTNCLGNLIVGYNDLGNLQGDDRTGSHNIVGGNRNSYSSYGGFIVGSGSSVSAPYAAISGGENSRASGFGASISGGQSNVATGTFAAVSGGTQNTASASWAAVSGGLSNLANGSISTVSGGRSNTASGPSSHVSGGANNAASHDDSVVSGGCASSTGAACDHVP